MQPDTSFDYRKLLKWILISLTVTPIIVTPDTLFPLIFGKASFIRFVLMVFLGALFFYVYKKREFYSLSFKKLLNPIFITFSIFVLLALVSTLFAESSYRAFWGNIERGEGWNMLFYMLILLGGSLLVFKKRDWLDLFKATTVVGLALCAEALIKFFNTFDRAYGSYIGNPSFLATYGIVLLFAAWVLVASEKSQLWRVLGSLGVAMALMTVFATQTRGAIIGMWIGLLATSAFLIYLSSRREGILERFRARLKWIGIGFVVVSFVVVGMFIATKDNSFWQDIPGFDRLAQMSWGSNTIQTRLINLKIGLSAISPMESSPLRTLIGWGPENYGRAFWEHYDPSIQRYELNWFDKAHNQLLDVVVMYGVLGLLAYLVLWGNIFRLIIKNHFKSRPMVSAAAIFFASAYFIQNLFLFDQIATLPLLILFFGFVASVYGGGQRGRVSTWLKQRAVSMKEGVYRYALGILFVVSIVGFIWISVVPYRQMMTVANALESGDFGKVAEHIDIIAHPDNYAQAEIRSRLLSVASGLVNNPEAHEFLRELLILQSEVIQDDTNVPKAHEQAAFLYKEMSKNTEGSVELLEEAENHLRKAVEIIPGRQHNRFLLADNLVAQGRFDEAIEIVEEMIEIEPDGLRAPIYWISIIGPYDWAGSRESLDYLANFYSDYVASVGRGLNPNSPALAIMRTSYKNYLIHFTQTRNAIGFLSTIQQAIAMEQVVDRVNEFYAQQGIIDEMPSEVDGLRGGMIVFVARGWEAIRIGQ